MLSGWTAGCNDGFDPVQEPYKYRVMVPLARRAPRKPIGEQSVDFWQKTKRNHGLEHGTISLLLSRSDYEKPMAGYSIPTGFLVLGNVTTEQVETNAEEALRRLQAGEHDLAVSPFCGTNIVVGAGLATIASLAGYRLAGRGWHGINRAFSNTVMAILASRPLGRIVQQRYTTSPDAVAMSIDGVTSVRIGGLAVHWVATTFRD
jgi:hypothetical protein